jgi:hypothetical protein
LKLVASNATFSFQLALNLNFAERTFNVFMHAAARPGTIIFGLISALLGDGPWDQTSTIYTLG